MSKDVTSLLVWVGQCDSCPSPVNYLLGKGIRDCLMSLFGSFDAIVPMVICLVNQVPCICANLFYGLTSRPTFIEE